jgi:hypothetical protein
MSTLSTLSCFPNAGQHPPRELLVVLSPSSLLPHRQLFLTSPVQVLSARDESPLAKFMVSGLVSWIFELGLGHPLELLKISRQTTNQPYSTIISNVRDIVLLAFFLGTCA